MMGVAPRPAPFLRRLWEHGIHPREPIFLKYFNKERCSFINALWQEYFQKWLVKPVEAKKPSVKKDQAKFHKGLIGVEGLSSTIMDEARWSLFWSWRRVAEDDRMKTQDERYQRELRSIKV